MNLKSWTLTFMKTELVLFTSSRVHSLDLLNVSQSYSILWYVDLALHNCELVDSASLSYWVPR